MPADNTKLEKKYDIYGNEVDERSEFDQKMDYFDDRSVEEKRKKKHKKYSWE